MYMYLVPQSSNTNHTVYSIYLTYRSVNSTIHVFSVITPTGLALKNRPKSGVIIIPDLKSFPAEACISQADLPRCEMLFCAPRDNFQTFGVLIFSSLPQWPLPNLKVHLAGIRFGQNRSYRWQGANPVLRRLRAEFVEWGLLARVLAPGMEHRAVLSALQAGWPSGQL